MLDAFFTEDDTGFIATELTRGPWSPAHQHGGPPAALLGRAMERFKPRDGMRIARITVEILKPVPISTLEVSVTLERSGKSVELLQSSLRASGVEVMRASAWRIRTASLELPRPLTAPLPPPETGTLEPFFSASSDVGYHRGVEWRFIRGGFREPGPGVAWLRMKIPLIAGEEPSPLVRVLVVADSGNGVSAPLDHNRYLFVNTDLTVQLHRPAEGEWIGLEAESIVEPSGIGVTETVLHDRRGRIGRGLQTLFVAPR